RVAGSGMGSVQERPGCVAGEHPSRCAVKPVRAVGGLAALGLLAFSDTPRASPMPVVQTITMRATMSRRSRSTPPAAKPEDPPRVGWLGRMLLLSPYWSRSIWHRLARLTLYLVGMYLGVLLMLLVLENWFLFHPDTAQTSWYPPPAGQEVQDVFLP